MSLGPFDPSRYPGPRPSGPSLVLDGACYAVTLDLSAPAGVVADPSLGHAPVLAADAVRWVVAYGSNASPPRLRDKGLDRHGVILLPAELAGWVPAFEHRRTSYGAVPLTLVPKPDRRVATWVAGVHRDVTDVVDASEGRRRRTRGRASVPLAGPADGRRPPPGAYELAQVGTVPVLGGRAHLHGAVAYVAAAGTAVQVDEVGAWRTWPQVDQAAALAHLERGGPWRPAAAPDTTHLGDWPTTPLTD